MMAFTLPITIRFQHCDMAGIVFYPRYFEMFNLVIEEWFEQVIGVGFNRLHANERMGIPLVRIETDFKAMSRLEDRLDFNLTIKHLGNSSLKCVIEAVCDGELRCRADMTLVCVDLDRGEKQSWPEFVRSKVKI
jgi:4-hydroxybenzoyl-CoA thioesterase